MTASDDEFNTAMIAAAKKAKSAHRRRKEAASKAKAKKNLEKNSQIQLDKKVKAIVFLTCKYLIFLAFYKALFLPA